MKLPVEIRKESGIPLYVQLAEEIRLLVHRGELRPGDQMPTVRELSVALGINANTVARVYRDLQREGLLALKRGVGTFVTEAKAGAAIGKKAYEAIERKAAELVELSRRAGLGPGEISRLIEALMKEDGHAER